MQRRDSAVRWKPKSDEGASYRWYFPIISPLVLDDGTRILWEWVRSRLVVQREWGGMGADGWEGYTEYFDRDWKSLGRVTYRS
jgi:hypothetical protein